MVSKMVQNCYLPKIGAEIGVEIGTKIGAEIIMCQNW